MHENLSYKLLFRSRDDTQRRITRQEKNQPTAWRVNGTHLAHRQIAYRCARMTAIRIGWPVTSPGRMCELMKIVSGHPFQIMPDRPRTPQWPTSQRSIDAPPSSAIMVTALGNWRAARRPTRLPLQPPVRGLDPRGPETRRSACSIPVLRCRARSESCGRCRRRGLR